MSCQKDNQFLIAKNQVGALNYNTKLYEVDSLLPSDSVVTINARNAYGNSLASVVKEIEVYDTSGLQILNIKPSGGMDTLSGIRSIRILSDKFKTENKIGLGSKFGDLKQSHTIGNIQSLANSFIITLEDINALVAFDRSVLPGEIRYDMDAEIKTTMIPDDAEIERFWINFSEVKTNE